MNQIRPFADVYMYVKLGVFRRKHQPSYRHIGIGEKVSYSLFNMGKQNTIWVIRSNHVFPMIINKYVIPENCYTVLRADFTKNETKLREKFL